jgi:hypothetical protein
MKALQAVKIACLLFVVVLPATVKAQFTFTTDNGAITITGYNFNPNATTRAQKQTPKLAQ